jgi:hypothetical protein
MRRHDEAVHGWFGGLLVDYGTVSGTVRNQVPILRVMASPDRAWAALENILVSQKWVAGANDDERRKNARQDFDTLPLPFLSIERADPQPYLDGGGVPKRFRRQRFVGGTQQWEEHAWPGSYRTEYRATFWSSKRYTMEWMREWIFSQLGKLGAAEPEVFIQVQHADPWGPLPQALHFDGSADLSELEGDKPRYLRSEWTFTLNTLHFRAPVGVTDFQDTVAVGAAFADEVDSTLIALEDLTGVDLFPATLSGNLYQPYYPPPLIPTRWPKAGSATVANSTVTPDDRPDRGALLVTVETPSDQVDLLNRPVKLDTNGYAILSYAFQYLSDVAVDLDVQQHDGTNMTAPVWTRVDKQTLPVAAEWSRVHGFTLVSQPIFDLAIIGTGSLARSRFAQLRVKHVHSGTKASPTSSSVVSGNTRYLWTGVLAQPYLVAVVFTAAAGSGTVTIENDQASPDFTRSEAVNTSTQRSVVFLVQPKATSIVLRVPLALTIDAVYLQRYDGGYGGNDV